MILREYHNGATRFEAFKAIAANAGHSVSFNCALPIWCAVSPFYIAFGVVTHNRIVDDDGCKVFTAHTNAYSSLP